ncbi:hypothetical protein BDV18DRAFT_166016 [Aspergillus unguis]
MPPASALSQTLESLTRSKIRELEKQRSSYEDRKAAVLREAENQPDLLSRVDVILRGTKAILPGAASDRVVINIGLWLDQRRFDASITDEMLKGYEEELTAKMDAHSRKLSLADLYSRLLTEWTDPSNDVKGHDEDDAEEYAIVDEKQKQRLQLLCDQFEDTVFTPLETDPKAIHAFLDELFPDDEKAKEMDKLRERIGASSKAIFEEDIPFDNDTLPSTIKGLLTEDLLSEEKQVVLKDILKNSVALTEIADVLNMRWADIDNWDWFCGDEGIPVLPRQQLNGKYRIWMDEDVLQLIFVQYIGTRLCNLLKFQLSDFIVEDTVWNWKVAPPTTEDDMERQRYYLGRTASVYGPEITRKSEYLRLYFLCQLPSSLTTLAEGGASYDDDDADDDNENTPTPGGCKNIKQHLLRKVATETLMQRNIYSEAAVIQSDLRWYATGLPHSTIFAVMSYLGFSEKWIKFFRKYLESPLNMDASSEGRAPVGPRTRKRGVPMAHASEKFTGEMILFFMDLAVNSKTGLLLYRLHDDLWLCGEPGECADAWDVMNTFAKVTGLEFNLNKTGSVYLSESADPAIERRLPKGPVTIGFQKLDPSGAWLIDQAQVAAHVKQLKTQLDSCNSIMQWIRTWNSCIGRFFKNTFGQPATCFGQEHVDMILNTYKDMQQTLFGNKTVTEHLREMIQSRFGSIDIPDAFFYYPEELGGLGLRNPAIAPFLVRNSLHTSPIQHIEIFLATEKQRYKDAKKDFDELSQTARISRFARANNGRERRFVSPSERDTFMSFDEWSRFRWSHSFAFQRLYLVLQEVPEPREIEFTLSIPVGQAGAQGRNLDDEKRWILQMYGEEVLKDYGGVALVDRKYLPVGVMAMVKERRVKWQMVL